MILASNQIEMKRLCVTSDPGKLDAIVRCLAAQGIPHQAYQNPEGEWTINVAAKWMPEAENLLSDHQKAPTEIESDKNDTTSRAQANAFERLDFAPHGGLASADETRLRSVRIAWLLACLPGLGLGHLYAGMTQIFLYLVFLSALGFLFFHLTGSYASFLLVVFSWALDLGFAALHVKQHNHRARRLKKAVDDAERCFLESLEK